MAKVKEPKGKTELRKIIAALYVSAGLMSVDAKLSDQPMGDAENWCRLLGPLRELYWRGSDAEKGGCAVKGKVPDYCFSVWNIDEYVSVDKATDLLWRNGARP